MLFVVQLQTFLLILGVHPALGDQQDRSQHDQNGAADVQQGGACVDGGGVQKASPLGVRSHALGRKLAGRRPDWP